MSPTLLLLLFPAPCEAYELTHMAFAQEDLPLEVWLAGDPEETVPEGYVEEAFEVAAAQWREASCGALDAELVGTLDEAMGFERDGLSVLSFNDPAMELQAGVRSATLVWTGSEELFTTGGTVVRAALEADIVFNNDVDFTTDAEIEAGECEGSLSLVGELVHALGHAFGLGHSCEAGDRCTDPRHREASMYWSQSACNTQWSSLNEDDVYGALQITGAVPSFVCETPAELNIEPEQLTIVCELDGRAVERVTSVEWTTGDGQTVTDHTLTHTYEQPGEYGLEACFTVDDPWCGVVTHCTVGPQVFKVCPTLEPAMEVVPLTETMVQLSNLTPYGIEYCVPSSWWVVTDASEEEVYSSPAWSPVVELPSPGTYTATLVFLIGREEYLTVEESFTLPFVLEEEDEGSGCSTADASSLWALLLALLATPLRRRRR